MERQIFRTGQAVGICDGAIHWIQPNDASPRTKDAKCNCNALLAAKTAQEARENGQTLIQYLGGKIDG